MTEPIKSPEAQTESAKADSVQRWVMPPYTIDDLRDSIRQIDRQLTHGCGNHGCRIKPPTGMGTNAICRCTPTNMAKRLLNLSLFLEEMGRDWRHNVEVCDGGRKTSKLKQDANRHSQH